jgi:hypothetical protein
LDEEEMAFKSHLDGRFGRRRRSAGGHHPLQQNDDDDDIEDPSLANHVAHASHHINMNTSGGASSTSGMAQGSSGSGIGRNGSPLSSSSAHRVAGDALFEEADDDKAVTIFQPSTHSLTYSLMPPTCCIIHISIFTCIAGYRWITSSINIVLN